jgi:hypothetical protein
MAVENLLARVVLRLRPIRGYGANTPENQKTPSRQQKGGSTQSRLNLTNHHYKEPNQATYGLQKHK